LRIVAAAPAWGGLHELSAPHRRTQAPAAARQWPSTRPPAPAAASPWDGGAAFHVHEVLAQEREPNAPPPRREVILAAYRAHLAERVRYFGPLTPIDLRV
jgi:hypothetical protein